MAERPIASSDYPPMLPTGRVTGSDGPVRPEAARPEAGRSGAAGSRRWTDVWVMVGLVLLACTITALAVERAPSLSAFDESTHIDYAWRVAHGQLPYAGAEITPKVLSDWSCRSQDNSVDQLPPCGEVHPAADYPGAGQNYNFNHPPTYYLVTAVAARAVGLLPFDPSFISVARLTGAGWLAAALVGLYLVLRTWRVPRLLAATASVVLAAVPSVAHASSVVTNDAPAALSGVLALSVLTRIVVREKHGWLLPVLVTAFVASTKVMNAVALLAVAGIVLLLGIAAGRAGDRARAVRLAGVAVGIVGTILAVWLSWTAFQETRALAGWTSPIRGVNTSPVEGSPVDEWLPTLFSSFGITQDFWLQDALLGFAVVASAGLLSIVMTAAPFANVAAFRAGDARRLVGWTAMLGCAAVPVVVQVQTYVGDGDFFRHVTSRYGLSLLPLTIAAFVLVAQARSWRVAPTVLGAVCISALLLSFAGVLATGGVSGTHPGL
jgi:hypothetical protein